MGRCKGKERVSELFKWGMLICSVNILILVLFQWCDCMSGSHH